MKRFFSTVCVLGALSACSPEPGPTTVRLRASGTRSDALVAKAIGLDCSLAGRDGCTTGVCVHTSPEPGQGRVCSAYCGGDENCPSGWKCKPLFPGKRENGLCLPPRDWQPAATTVAQPYQRAPIRSPDGGVLRFADGGVL